LPQDPSQVGAQTVPVPLVGGFYQARSPIANDIRCVNLYPEKNAEGAPTQFTDYLTPGLTLLRAAGSTNGPTSGQARPGGAYLASNGGLYIIIGSTVYFVDQTWRFFTLGNLTTSTGLVCMQDNGNDLAIVDGTISGFSINLTTNLMTPYPGISVDGATVAAGGSGGTNGAVSLTVVGGVVSEGDVTTLDGTISGGALTAIGDVSNPGTYSSLPANPVAVTGGGLTGATVNLSTTNGFLGADRVDYLDTFLLFNEPNTRNFYSSLSNVLTLDPTFIASKTSYPDNIQTLMVIHRELWLLGAQKSTELWYDAGGTQFPFQIEPGVYIEQGCVAKASVARHDLALFWLGINADGKAMVFRGANYLATRISTFAIADEISKYSVISDAIGMVYQQLDHIFYVLTFPTANKTWVWDDSQGLWHERVWIDSNGQENRIRPNFLIAAYGMIIAGDWETGDLYQYDINNETDNGQPIVRIRGFPHYQTMAKRNSYSRFTLDMECGTALNSSDHWVSMRYSYDKGKTWMIPQRQSLGAQGEYLVWPTWAGSQGLTRDMLYEISFTSPVSTALNGAYANVVPAAT
jgi:hypothetical protein